MDVHSFLFLLLTATCPSLLQAQSREGGPQSFDCSSRSEVDELKNITLILLKEFLSFSASVKADLTAMKLNLISLQSELGQVSNTVITNKRKIKAQDVVLDGFQSQLDSIQQAVERDTLVQGEQLCNHTSALVSQLADQQLGTMQTMERDILDQVERVFNQTSALTSHHTHQQLESLQVVEREILDQGEWLFNQTSAVSTLVSQLADQQDVFYHNLSNEVSSLCSARSDDPPTQAYTTEPPASTESLTTTVSPTSTTGSPTIMTGSPTIMTVSPTSTTGSPTIMTGSPTIMTGSPTESPASTSEPVTSPTVYYSCGGTLGWRRVAFLNMTDPIHQCPSGWRLTDYSKRTCGRASTSHRTCDSATFPTGEQRYSRVCGRILAYQFGTISAFYSSLWNIESVYVNGLSVTRGSPRQHVWTFAGGLAESGNQHMGERCPCDGGTRPVPDFVGNDYYCESGINGPWISRFVFHPEDRLWDGEDCVPASSCCAGTTLPYFVKELGSSTTDDIEARICSVYIRSVSDIAIELVEFYVQ